MPPEGNCPTPVRDGVWVKVRVSFRVGGQPDKIAPEESPPGMVRVSFSVSFAVGGGAIAPDLENKNFIL